jgi:hypothetical protein
MKKNKIKIRIKFYPYFIRHIYSFWRNIWIKEPKISQLNWKFLFNSRKHKQLFIYSSLAWIVNERTYDLLIDFDNWFQSFKFYFIKKKPRFIQFWLLAIISKIKYPKLEILLGMRDHLKRSPKTNEKKNNFINNPIKEK